LRINWKVCYAVIIKSKEMKCNEKQSFGNMIATLRKENGMTQLELANKMGVTDKAVSKWERDLSFPNVGSLPKLAELFHISIDELMQVKADAAEKETGNGFEEMAMLILKAVSLAMGVSVAALSFMNEIETDVAVGMLGIGLACLAIVLLRRK